ncbi:SRPBCC family protein [Gorillibacterium sp. CAU 1737]|uniref:SRPBCC family protein n=1 Tax=Gorillibacterium sp. CAU 1737 TaxID=3140362 RepID=UPI003261A85D
MISKRNEGYEARFKRHFAHQVEEVWSYLVENDKLRQWFPELQVADLREGEVIRFHMGDDRFEEMNILSFASRSVLEYTWGEDRVRFELTPEPGGSRLLLVESLGKLTDHTPRDLAGWHVCLEVIKALLEGRPVEGRRSQWEERYRDYSQLVNDIR